MNFYFFYVVCCIIYYLVIFFFFFQAEDGIRDLVRSRGLGDVYKRQTLYYRLHWDRPSYTITCYFTNVSSGPFVHPSEDRAITPREAARLQSFPDTYQFFDKNIARQIGNAVPPVLALAVATRIAQTLHLKSESRERVALTA